MTTPATPGTPAQHPDPATPASGMRQHLRHLADQCDQAADALDQAAADPAATLQARGYDPATTDLDHFQTTKQQAAAAARAWAQHLRTQATTGQAPDLDHTCRRAEAIVSTALAGGITIDTSTMPDTDPHHAHLQHDLAAEGHLQHVATPGQVPYYRLVAPTAGQAEAGTSTAAQRHDADDPADGW